MTRPVGARYRRGMRMPGSLLRRVRELPPTVADGLLAALLTVIALPMLFLPSENFERLFATSFRDPGSLGVLLTLCQTVPLTWRRRAPYAVLAVTTAAAIVHLALGFKPTFAEAAMVVSLYTVAAHRPRRHALTAAAGVRRRHGRLRRDRRGQVPEPVRGQPAVLGAHLHPVRRRLLPRRPAEAAPGLHGQAGGAQHPAGHRAGAALALGGGRGAGPDRPRAARRGRPLGQRDGRPGRGGPAHPGRQPRPGGGRPRPDRVDRPPGPGRDAPPPRAAARRRPGGRRRPRPPAEPGAPGLAGRGRPRGRPAGRGDGRGRAAAAAGRGRPLGLPDRAGGADQLAQARRPGPGQGPDLLRP